MTDSDFIKSLWGDEKLFFQHGGLNLDARSHRRGSEKEWDIKSVAEHDFDRWGAWKNSYRVPDVRKEQVLDGITGKGCPFWWVIQYINNQDELDNSH